MLTVPARAVRSTTRSPPGGPLILVTGARGAVGSGVVTGLRAAGVPVRAADRDPDRLELPDDVERVRLDLADPSSFDPALEGVRAVFCYVTGDLGAFATAAARAGVEHTVLLSSESVLLEPEPAPGGLAAHHADAETALLGGPADESAHLTGPESLTFAEQVGIVAAHLGRPIEVREVDPSTVRERMLARMPEGMVDSLFRYWAHTLDGPAAVTGEVGVRTGHPARTYASWVADTL